MPEAVVYALAYAGGQAVAVATGISILGTLTTIAVTPAVGSSVRRRVLR